jgi:hypothetical protein
MYTIAVTKDKTTIYMKVPYDCLSYKQKMHRGISKLNLKKTLTCISNALKKDVDEDKVELIQE